MTSSRHVKVFVTIVLLSSSATSISAQTNNYFGTSGTLSGSVWSTNPAGPYTSPFDTTGGGIANFQNAASFTGASITVAGINATANATATAIGGTISNAGNSVITIDVSNGVTLDFAGQAFTTSTTAGYIKNNTGVLALTGGTYGGGFTLNAGTVIVRGVNAMGGGASNSLTLNGGIVASNATRDLSGKYTNGITIGGNIQFGDVVGLASASANLTFSNNMSLGGSTRTMTLGNGGVVAFGGVISNSGGVGVSYAGNANGTGRFDITNAANTYSGSTIITGVEARFTADGSFGAVPGAFSANNIILDGGRLSTASATSYTINANRGMQVSATTGNVISVTTSGTLTYNGVIADLPSTTGTWAKQGAGILELGGVSTYSGNTSINNGILRLNGGNDRLPTGTTVNFGQASTNTLGTLNLNGQSQTIAGLNSILGTNGTSSKNTVTSATSATLTLNGSGNYFFSDGTAANSGTISGSLSVVKNGSGSQTLGDISNTYSGTTTINGGFIAVNSEGSFGANPGAFNASQITLNGGGIRAINTSVDFGSNRGITLGSSGGTFDTNGQSISFNVPVVGTGSLTKVGSGLLTMPAASTYGGNTFIQNDTLLAYGGNDRLPTTTVVTLGSGSSSGVLQLGNPSIGGAINQTIAGLTHSGTGTGNAVLGNDAAISVLTVNNSANYQFGGTLGGAGTNNNNLALVKSGSGTLTLFGNNTYVGTTTVNGGTLNVDGSHSSSDTYTVNSGTLGGNGTINSDIDIFAATLAPGNSVGRLTVNGNVTFSSTSTFRVEINGTNAGVDYDQLSVGAGGALSLNNAALTATLGYFPQNTDMIFLTDNMSGAIGGIFNGLPDGSIITIGSFNATISYFGNFQNGTISGGDDVVIYNFAVPEPGTIALLGLTGFFGLQWYLRRKPQNTEAKAEVTGDPKPEANEPAPAETLTA